LGQLATGKLQVGPIVEEASVDGDGDGDGDVTAGEDLGSEGEELGEHEGCENYDDDNDEEEEEDEESDDAGGDEGRESATHCCCCPAHSLAQLVEMERNPSWRVHD
jgi:hypothetical protein